MGYENRLKNKKNQLESSTNDRIDNISSVNTVPTDTITNNIADTSDNITTSSAPTVSCTSTTATIIASADSFSSSSQSVAKRKNNNNIPISSTTTTTTTEDNASTSSSSLIKRRKNNEENNNNNDNDKLQKAIINLFNNIEKHIIANLNKVFSNMETKNFTLLKNFCLDQPTLIFNAIDYIFPHIKYNSYKNTKEEILAYIKVLEKGFNENNEVIKFLNKHSKDILKLIEHSAILDALYKISTVFLLDLLDYHGIPESKSKDEIDLKKLIIAEYVYRNKSCPKTREYNKK